MARVEVDIDHKIGLFQDSNPRVRKMYEDRLEKYKAIQALPLDERHKLYTEEMLVVAEALDQLPFEGMNKVQVGDIYMQQHLRIANKYGLEFKKIEHVMTQEHE